ncbi:MAG: hypothetical protein QG645_749, partial [Patescibacteria group bacterium]|nr:hypothetical protein [Patescibacteria group bacterium]
VVLKKSIDSIDSENLHSDVRALINKGHGIANDIVEVHEYNSQELEYLSALQLPKSSFFTNLGWVHEVENKIINVNELYVVNRGERRGWDKLFFPPEGSEIETDYLKPVLKSPRNIDKLDATPDGLAFCCLDSKEELIKKNCEGALRWIESFESQVNGKGKPLPQVLQRPGINWYTMKPDTVGDIVTANNPGDRLFFSKFEVPAFVNQRLIRFSRISQNTNNDLTHTLLNSVLGLFYLEALGFGRGEGVLDLSATKLDKSMKILNPALLSTEQVGAVLAKFSVLKKREILPIKQELNSQDRIDFDQIVFDSFGISHVYEDVRKSLLDLYEIRTSINES